MDQEVLQAIWNILLKIPAVYPRSIKMLDGATVVPGSFVVKPVFYSHCYADDSDLDPYFLNNNSSLKNQYITATSWQII